MISKFKTFSIFFILFLLWGGAGFAASQVIIDSSVYSSGRTGATHLGTTPTVVFTSDQTGYDFYRDSNGTCVYRKTSNAGSSWGNPVVVDTQTDCLGIGVWYDAWTPHLTSSRKIHILTWDTGDQDLWYTEFNPATDTSSAPIDVSIAQAGTVGFGLNYGSITRTVDGTIYVGIQSAGDSFVLKCSSSCTVDSNWSEAGSNPFDLADDFLLLEPLSNSNLLAIRWDISANALQSKVYDVNANSWDVSWTNIDTSVTPNNNGPYDNIFSAVVDPKTDKVYLIYGANLVDINSDDEVRSAVYDGIWTTAPTTSKVVTSGGSLGVYAVALAIDPQTGKLYALYSEKGVGISYKTSTDGMITWSVKQGGISSVTSGLYGLRVNSVSNDRLYASWFSGFFTLLGNTLADLTPPVASMNDITKTVGEGDGSSSITVNLNTVTRSDVVVDFTVSHVSTISGDYSFSTSSLVIPANSNSATIPFTINDDADIEINEVFNVTLSGGVGVTLGSSLTTAVTINDNELPPKIAFTSVDISNDESVTSANLTVNLSAVSGYDITVDYATSDGTAVVGSDYTLATGTITIPAGSLSATVPVVIIDDALDEADETFNVTLSNPINATLDTSSVALYTIKDNDAPPTVSWTALTQSSVSESGILIATVQMSSASGQLVTVPFTLSGTAGSDSDYTISTSSITLAIGDTTGTATITIVDDTIDEVDETVILSINAPINADVGATGVHTATLVDDDVPTVSWISSAQSSADESGLFNLKAELSMVSVQPVIVPFTLSGTATDGADYTIASSSITILAGDTQGAETINVASDFFDEADETIIVTMGVPTNAVVGALSVHTATITDDDTFGITLLESGVSTSVTEGDSAVDTYTLVLTSAPTDVVNITLSPDVNVTVDQELFKFDSSNWNILQTVSVSANNDDIAEGLTTSEIVHSVSSNDLSYDDFALQNVSVKITDDDSAGVSIIESSGSTKVTENGDTDTYFLSLTSEPTADVVITISFDDQLTANVTAVTFTSANWDVPQVITVSAVNDDVTEGDHLATFSHVSASSDANYNGLTLSDMSASITDDDSAGVSIVESGSATTVTEGGATDSYAIVLTSEPTGDVVVTISPSGQVEVNVASITFTKNNWDSPQSITITAIDDDVAEGDHSATLAHSVSGSDANYQDIPVAPLTIAITDNDLAGVSIVETNGATKISEAGKTDSYTIVLTSEPSADVEVKVIPNAQITVNVASVVFTAANWQEEQLVVVTAVDDTVLEGAHAGLISHEVVSDDPQYNGHSVATVIPSIIDNEANPATSAPNASAGDDQTMTAGESLTLDGSDSTGTDLSYTWSITSGDGTLTDAETDSPTLTVSASAEAQDITILLTVTDSGDDTDTDEVVVHVLAKSTTGSGSSSGCSCSFNDQDTGSLKGMIGLIFLALIILRLLKRNLLLLK